MTDYLLEREKLTALEVNGKKKWTYNFIDNYTPFISHKSDTFFLIKERPRQELIGLMANNGQILFKLSLNGLINNPLVINESIIYIENTELKSASRLTGKREWKKDLNLDNNFKLISKKHFLVGYTHDNRIICVDSRSGKTIWKSNKNFSLQFDPVIQNDSIYIVNKKDEIYEIINMDLSKGYYELDL